MTITESLQYMSLGVDNPSADTGERDERPDDNDGESAASGSKQTHPNVPSKIPAGRFLSLCRHPQARPGTAKQFPSVSEITPIRQLDSQATRTTKEPAPRMVRGCQDSKKNHNSESSPAASGLVADSSTSVCRPNGEPKECPAKTRRYPPRVKTTAGSTSSMANDATREHLCLSQRPQDSSFVFTDGAQEVFGRRILRIQPHGTRNAYIITFLPDVIPPSATLSTSEMPSEKSSDSSDHGSENSARAQLAGNIPGIQNDIPIDPLILADNGP